MKAKEKGGPFHISHCKHGGYRHGVMNKESGTIFKVCAAMNMTVTA